MLYEVFCGSRLVCENEFKLVEIKFLLAADIEMHFCWRISTPETDNFAICFFMRIIITPGIVALDLRSGLYLVQRIPTLDLPLKALDLRFFKSADDACQLPYTTQNHIFCSIFAGFTVVGFTVFTLVASWNLRISHAPSLRNELCVGAQHAILELEGSGGNPRTKRKNHPKKRVLKYLHGRSKIYVEFFTGAVRSEVPGWSCGCEMFDGWWIVSRVINPSYLCTRPFISYKWCLGCIFSFQRGYQLSCAGRASAQISAMGVGGPMVQAGACGQWVELVGSQLVLLVHEQWKKPGLLRGFWGDSTSHFYGDFIHKPWN